MPHRRRYAGEPAHRPNTGVEIENLPQRDVQRTNAAAHRSGERALDGYAKIARRFHSLLRQPFLEFVVGLFASEHLEPNDAPLAAVSLLNGRIEDALRSLPDIAARAVAFDVGNDRPVGNLEFAAGILDGLAIMRHG